MDTPCIKLRLCAPLIYKKIEKNDDYCINLTKNDDLIQCYNINLHQSTNIEPDREQFLGPHIFSGLRIEEKNFLTNQAAGEEEKPSQEATLPKGHYLLVQQRSACPLTQPEWLEMAIEQQKDGLWERNKLGRLLYVRYLFEDGQFVTQVFRQVI